MNFLKQTYLIQTVRQKVIFQDYVFLVLKGLNKSCTSRLNPAIFSRLNCFYLTVLLREFSIYHEKYIDYKFCSIMGFN